MRGQISLEAVPTLPKSSSSGQTLHARPNPKSSSSCHQGSRAGQTSVELILILSAALMVLTIAVIVGQTQLQASQNLERLEQARAAVSDVASAATTVYSQGAGAQRKVFVKIPETVAAERVFIDGSIVNIGLYMEGGISDVNAKAGARMVGELPNVPGGYWILVTAKQGCVAVGENTEEYSC